MKTLYFSFGAITMLFAIVILFNVYHAEFLDDYWINLLHNEYYEQWKRITYTIATLSIFSFIIWIYNLGKGTDKKEPLLINKEKENE